VNVLEIIFLGIVQGITEWLPISSSGHLVLFEKWLNIDVDLSFDIFLHLATLLVILWFFRSQIKEVILAPFGKAESDKKRWWLYIMVSSFFTAILGYIFYEQIDTFRTVDSVSGWLLVTSMLLLATKFSKGEKDLNIWHAIALGLAQGFAVLPGLSRSGAVIALALTMKIKKDQAFEYGFIVAIPAILGSFLLTIKDIYAMFSSVGSEASIGFNWTYLAAFLVTMVVSYLSLSLLKVILKRDYFYLFFIYTLVLAVIIKLN